MNTPEKLVKLLKDDPMNMKKLNRLFYNLPEDFDLNYSQFQIKDNDMEIIKKCIFLYLQNTERRGIWYLINLGFQFEVKEEILKNIKDLNFTNYTNFCMMGIINENEIYPYLNIYQKIFYYYYLISILFFPICIFLFAIIGTHLNLKF